MDNISDEHIDSLCHRAVEGKNVKKAKKSLRKQTNTSSVLDLGKTQYLFFKQAIECKKNNLMMTVNIKIRLVLKILSYPGENTTDNRFPLDDIPRKRVN